MPVPVEAEINVSNFVLSQDWVRLPFVGLVETAYFTGPIQFKPYTMNLLVSRVFTVVFGSRHVLPNCVMQFHRLVLCIELHSVESICNIGLVGLREKDVFVCGGINDREANRRFN